MAAVTFSLKPGLMAKIGSILVSSYARFELAMLTGHLRDRAHVRLHRCCLVDFARQQGRER